MLDFRQFKVPGAFLAIEKGTKEVQNQTGTKSWRTEFKLSSALSAIRSRASLLLPNRCKHLTNSPNDALPIRLSALLNSLNQSSAKFLILPALSSTISPCQWVHRADKPFWACITTCCALRSRTARTISVNTLLDGQKTLSGQCRYVFSSTTFTNLYNLVVKRFFYTFWLNMAHLEANADLTPFYLS